MLENTWALPREEEVCARSFGYESGITDESSSFVLSSRLGCELDMQELAENKDIMYKIPPKTRLRFTKRVLNRILRITNKYQQAFNNAVYRILAVQTGTLEWVKDGLVITDDKANRALMLAEQLKQTEQKLEKLQNQAQYNSEELEKQNFRLRGVEGKTEKLQNQIISGESGGSQVPSGAAASFSQSGEDTIVDYILERLQILPSEVTYLDLGANHASYLSNTYSFYRRNAHGVLVEANPELIPELEQQRERDIILNRCVSKTSGEKITFHILSGDGLSTCSTESVDEITIENPDIHLVRTVEVETITVNDILESYFDSSPTFINLDIEGMEMEILRNIDFEACRPLIIIVETIPYRVKLSSEEKNTEIVSFMRLKDYSEYAFTGINSIFVDKRRLQNQ